LNVFDPKGLTKLRRALGHRGAPASFGAEF
jgi:hypothetical protein